MKKRKDGRYQKNIYIGRDENGKRKYKSVCGTSRKEVETLAAELKQKLGKGIDISSDDTYGCWKNAGCQFRGHCKHRNNTKRLNGISNILQNLSIVKSTS